jgi:IS30 family transposase
LRGKIGRNKVVMSHIAYEQRYTIEILLRTNEDKPSIAKKLSIDKSVLYREIKRNSDQRNGAYRAGLAHQKYQSRMRLKIKFTDDMKDKLNNLLSQEHNPEQISGVLIKNGEQMVSHERFYQHAWDDKKQKGQSKGL